VGTEKGTMVSRVADEWDKREGGGERERERKSRRINGETQDGHAEKSRKKTKWEREGKWRG